MRFKSVRSDSSQAGWGLKAATWAGVLFLHIPLALIILYAFSAEDKSYVFPPPGLTTQWFAAAWARDDVWAAIGLSFRVALIATGIEGVLKGYEKKLEIVGVGWGARVQGKKLVLTVGFANTLDVAIPDGVKVEVNQTMVTVSGPDKQAVGEFASKCRAKRKPEPYNGKGIKYVDEVIQRKQGKAFGS